MSYLKKYLILRDELWNNFELLVRKGAKFPQLLDVEYPVGINPEGLSVTTESRSYFLAKELIANPQYKLLRGEDIIVGSGKVTFLDTDGGMHELEPDILDLYWLATVLDGAA